MSTVLTIAVALLAAGHPVRNLSPGRVHAVVDSVPDAARAVQRLPDGRWVVSVPEWQVTPEMTLPDAGSKSSVTEASGAVIVRFYADVSPGDADAVLRQTGVAVLHHPDILPSERIAAATGEQVKALTEWDEVAKVYTASADLVEGQSVRSCTGPELVAGNVGFYTSNQGVGWDGVGLNGAELTWSVAGTLPFESAADVIARALVEWSRHAALRFRRTNNPNSARNLAYSFTRGEHLDPYPFDGAGRILAHAFYPADLNLEPIAGDVHLDADEPWAAGTDPDLYSVVLHETGHALGLGHSDRPGAVMYPYHRKLTTLQADDIAAIQRLYRTTPVAPLSVTFSAPLTTSQSFVEISGTVNGGSGEAVVTWAKGSEHGTAQGGRQWRTSAIPLTAGTNRIVITARDQAQNVASREAVITLSAGVPQEQRSDRVNPSLAITWPATTIYGTSAPTVVVRGTARDNVGVTEVTWQRGTVTGVATGTTAWSFELPLVVGDNSVIVRAKDAVGNTSWRSLMITRR